MPLHSLISAILLMLCTSMHCYIATCDHLILLEVIVYVICIINVITVVLVTFAILITPLIPHPIPHIPFILSYSNTPVNTLFERWYCEFVYVITVTI